jgi:hypothetical protein
MKYEKIGIFCENIWITKWLLPIYEINFVMLSLLGIFLYRKYDLIEK